VLPASHHNNYIQGAAHQLDSAIASVRNDAVSNGAQMEPDTSELITQIDTLRSQLQEQVVNLTGLVSELESKLQAHEDDAVSEKRQPYLTY